MKNLYVQEYQAYFFCRNISTQDLREKFQHLDFGHRFLLVPRKVLTTPLDDAKLGEATNGSMKDAKRPSFELRTSQFQKKREPIVTGFYMLAFITHYS